MANLNQARPSQEALQIWIARVRSGYSEDPGLRLTCLQATRFFGLEERTRRGILTGLVAAGFLKSAGEVFVREMLR